jgi:hypothetical protein
LKADGSLRDDRFGSKGQTIAAQNPSLSALVQ